MKKEVKDSVALTIIFGVMLIMLFSVVFVGLNAIDEAPKYKNCSQVTKQCYETQKTLQEQEYIATIRETVFLVKGE